VYRDYMREALHFLSVASVPMHQIVNIDETKSWEESSWEHSLATPTTCKAPLTEFE